MVCLSYEISYVLMVEELSIAAMAPREGCLQLCYWSLYVNYDGENGKTSFANS